MNFDDQVKQQRAALEKRKAALDTELSEINKQLKALDAYEATLHGTPSTTRRRGIRADVLALIQETPSLTRAQIIDHFNAKGDTSLKRSIDNALTALTKKGSISKRSDGSYGPVG